MKNRTKPALIANALLALALSINPAFAGMYKVVQPDGRVIYTDRPPQSAQGGRVTEIQAPMAPTPPIAAKPGNPGGQEFARPATLTMYSSAGCGHCIRAKAYLNSRGIPFREVDVDRDSAGRQEFIRLGGRGVPLFEKNGRTMTGFNPESLQALIGKST